MSDDDAARARRTLVVAAEARGFVVGAKDREIAAAAASRETEAPKKGG